MAALGVANCADALHVRVGYQTALRRNDTMDLGGREPARARPGWRLARWKTPRKAYLPFLSSFFSSFSSTNFLMRYFSLFSFTHFSTYSLSFAPSFGGFQPSFS